VLLKLQRENRQQNIVWKIHEDRSSQTSVACRRSLQWPGKLDFSPFWTARQIWPESGTKLKLGSFLHWVTMYASHWPSLQFLKFCECRVYSFFARLKNTDWANGRCMRCRFPIKRSLIFCWILLHTVISDVYDSFYNTVLVTLEANVEELIYRLRLSCSSVDLYIYKCTKH